MVNLICHRLRCLFKRLHLFMFTGSGAIEFDEFLRMMSTFQKENPDVILNSKLLGAFQMFDKDGNGFIR